MPTNRKRRGTEEMEGKCNRPKLNICQTWWKKRRCFLFCSHIHATMFLPADSELHLWIIWQQELGGNCKASFSDKHEYQYLNTLPIFQKLLFLVRGCRVGCFLFRIPSREEFNVCCILFCTECIWNSLLMKFTSFDCGDRPILVNNDKNMRASIHTLTRQSNAPLRDRRKICTSLFSGRAVDLRFTLPYNLSFLCQCEILRLIRKNLLGRDLKSADSSC